MVRKVQVVLQDDIDGGNQPRPCTSPWTARTTRSTSPSRTPQSCATAWHPGSPPARRASTARIPAASLQVATPGGHRRHPALGQGERHPGQRPRAHLRRSSHPVRGRPLTLPDAAHQAAQLGGTAPAAFTPWTASRRASSTQSAARHLGATGNWTLVVEVKRRPDGSHGSAASMLGASSTRADPQEASAAPPRLFQARGDQPVADHSDPERPLDLRDLDGRARMGPSEQDAGNGAPTPPAVPGWRFVADGTAIWFWDGHPRTAHDRVAHDSGRHARTGVQTSAEGHGRAATIRGGRT